MLGIWFGASIGVLVAWLVFFKITKQDWITLRELLIVSTTLWTLGTGVVRSTTSWSLPVSWAAGILVAYALYIPFIFTWVSVWWLVEGPARSRIKRGANIGRGRGSKLGQ